MHSKEVQSAGLGEKRVGREEETYRGFDSMHSQAPGA